MPDTAHRRSPEDQYDEELRVAKRNGPVDKKTRGRLKARRWSRRKAE